MTEHRLIALTSEEKAAHELYLCLKAALEWIDALPPYVGDYLPTMPGFDRDWANDVISKAEGGNVC